MKEDIMSTYTFEAESLPTVELQHLAYKVEDCRYRRGFRGCSQCQIYDECDLLKSLLRARYGSPQGSGGGSRNGDGQ